MHLILGSILACLVVFAFMRNWRSTIIAAVAIPSSVIATFGMMAALDFTLNSVTMLALVLMVGIVIDDAIVVLENIFRFIEEKRLSPFDAARAGDRGDRAAGAGDDAVPGRHLHPRLVHVEHLGTVPLPVRPDRGGGDPRVAARVVHADADDERAAVPAVRGPRPDEAARGRGFYRPHRPRLHSARWCRRCDHRTVVAVLAVLVIAVQLSALQGWSGQEFIPTDGDEAEFQLQVTAPEGTSTGGDGRHHSVPSSATCAASRASGRCLMTGRRQFLRQREQRPASSASRRTRSACSRSPACSTAS